MPVAHTGAQQSSIRLFRQRDRARRRHAVSGADVGGALPRIFFRRQRLTLIARFTSGLGKVPLEVRHAPSAAGPRPAALADLAGPARSVDPDVIQNLPLRDVEAVTDCVVEFHDFILHRTEPAPLPRLPIDRQNVCFRHLPRREHHQPLDGERFRREVGQLVLPAAEFPNPGRDADLFPEPLDG
jgi:hypothetical protein